MRLLITDFQSLGHVDLDVKGLTVIVGPSNRGKSALVRAVEAALFNKPGDEFVRTGKKRAVVEVYNAPTTDGTVLLDLKWTKGGGKNVYEIGGPDKDVYTKVGQGTPPPVTEAGYRDVWIGDKDRKKGEWLRPQVSSQHDRLFLLDRSGAFVSDVLGVISRHAVLLTAQGRATSDQRAAKQQLGYKQAELTEATAQLAALADVPVLAARVEALRRAYEARDQQAALVAHLRAVVDRRARYAPVAALQARPWVEWIGRVLGCEVARGRIEAAKMLVARQPVLRALGGSEAPPTVVPQVADVEDQRARFVRALRALVTLKVLGPLGAVTLPTLTSVPADLGLTLAKAKGLLAHRPSVAALAAATLPDAFPPTFRWGNFDATLAMRDTVAAAQQRRAAALDVLHRCETAVRSTRVEVEQAEAELSEALGELTICPVCNQLVQTGTFHAAHRP